MSTSALYSGQAGMGKQGGGGGGWETRPKLVTHPADSWFLFTTS